jgi:hypothetical protein
VQRIISTLAGVQGGSSFVTANSVANGNLADVKPFAYRGSINKTVVAFWFGNHDPRTPPAAITCQLTFTVPHPHSHSYVTNAITGTQVPSRRTKGLKAGPNLLFLACRYQITPRSSSCNDHLNNPQIENRSAYLRRVTGYATEFVT